MSPNLRFKDHAPQVGLEILNLDSDDSLLHSLPPDSVSNDSYGSNAFVRLINRSNPSKEKNSMKFDEKKPFSFKRQTEE